MRAFIILALIAYISAQNPLLDTSTYANINEIRTEHFHLNISLDFQFQKIIGSNTLFLKAQVDNVTEVILDARYLQIYRVYDLFNDQNLTFSVDKTIFDINLGQRLTILLDQPLMKDKEAQIQIFYSTSQNATALNWLTKEQTQTKVAPYLFSQCESINCRSIAPLQDTPSIKSTYSAEVHVDTPNVQVYMSANSTHNKTNYNYLQNGSTNGSTTTFHFSCSIPIQSYLLAIIAGNVERRQIGSRTGVITEPTDMDRCANELSDLEKFLDTVENYTIPYVWGTYNIVILPPSFPYGGMENPLLTFASPTIIVGDKSEVNVAVHEIAHSWTGNLVTMQNWGSFWLNEGFTVFLERKGLQLLYGKEFQKIAAYEGNASLTSAIQGFGVDSPYTQLCFVVGSANPDDVFSTIPYEKGYQFLQYVENFVGENLMQQFLRAYLTKFAYQSIVTEQFIQFFNEFFLQHYGEAILLVNLNQWIYSPGYAPAYNNFTTDSLVASKQLAYDYLKLNGTSSPSNFKDFFNFFTNLKLIFLETIQETGIELSEQLINRLNTDYQLDNSKSVSIRSIWYTITVTSRYKNNLNLIDAFLGEVGRMKYITPIYSALVGVDKDLALSLYNKYSTFYHPIAASQIKRILGLSTANKVQIQEQQQNQQFLSKIIIE